MSIENCVKIIKFVIVYQRDAQLSILLDSPNSRNIN